MPTPPSAPPTPDGEPAAGACAASCRRTRPACPSTSTPRRFTILAGKCAGCHTYGQADPAGWGSVLDVSRMIDSDIVVPGDAVGSRLIDRVAVVGDMPPKGERLKADEVQTLKDWIQAMRRPPEAILSDTDVLDEISRDQLRLRDRSSDYRYISFAHFVGQGRSEAEMEQVRQVFTYTLNSLSRRGELVEATTIDPHRSIFRFQLDRPGLGRGAVGPADRLLPLLHPLGRRRPRGPLPAARDRGPGGPW